MYHRKMWKPFCYIAICNILSIDKFTWTKSTSAWLVENVQGDFTKKMEEVVMLIPLPPCVAQCAGSSKK